MRKLLNKKGFTLAELLIVVAIIAVLVAIAIPIFTTQLEKAREQTDAANLRSAYAVAAAKVLETEGGVAAGPVKLTHNNGWDHTANEKIGTVALTTTGVPYNNGTTGGVYVLVDADGKMSITDTVPSTGYTKVDPVTGSAS
ncbi:MAG: prepilin-type N-terminal cleavage/methylation domain-containing protein [Clostridia bacterium]|nr:prepilin-type N-terminal cleavage/methylation domain-containing protein [Clostridia bacterium]